VFAKEDVTEDAKKVLKMFESFERDDRITVPNAVDCFRGMNGNAKGLSNNPHFGIGKDWDKAEAVRLIQSMIVEGALEEYSLQNGGGWMNAYVRVSLLIRIAYRKV
jgi:bloom syndrome protein